MTTQHIAPLPAPADRTERDPRAWVAPAIATVLLGVLGPAAVLFAGFSVMATDSCGPDDCSAALNTSLSWIFGLLRFGGPLCFVALLTAWLLPWQRRWSVMRAWTAVLAVLPPLGVLFLVFTLPAP
ncbi:hypothetical protein ABB07_29065 [Streptomyces incarnatus]|uniref:Integral membrane protein n=1 Tax=Streptomyces incarnatus TaxID=665007 RepID=A0ABM5TSE3_9ACTN|nr:hypothetical protein [Streptomyces incarnatus]AKJ13946.1 hypothetical protein ABB07_29065 [Streptomyces incarnatus]